MLKKKRVYLYLFVAVSVFLVFLFFIQQSESKLKPNNTDTLQDKKLIEVSEIANNDKDFYAIRLKKDEVNITIKNDYFKNIREMFITESTHIEEMDKAMTALLMDKKINRIDKINGLWSILKEIGFSSEKSEYLLDSLATLLPVELTDDFIVAYADKGMSHNMKIKIIEVLSDNLAIVNPEVQDEKNLEFIAQKVDNIKIFLKEKVLSDGSVEIASEGLHAYAAMSSSEDIQEFMVSLEEGVYNTDISKDIIRNVLIETALSTSESQADMLPQMLNNMKNNPNMDSKQKEAFTQMMIESLNAGVITEKSGKEFVEYLKNNEPTLQLNDGKSATDISKYYHWAEASSKIEDGGTSLVDTALNNENPLKVSSILLYGDSQTIQTIKESSNVGDMQVMLELALDDESVSNENKTIIKDATGVLKEDPPDVNKFNKIKYKTQ